VAADWKPQRTNRVLKSDGKCKSFPHFNNKNYHFLKQKKEFPIKLIFGISVALKD
jgi:hypothetical protein